MEKLIERKLPTLSVGQPLLQDSIAPNLNVPHITRNFVEVLLIVYPDSTRLRVVRRDEFHLGIGSLTSEIVALRKGQRSLGAFVIDAHKGQNTKALVLDLAELVPASEDINGQHERQGLDAYTEEWALVGVGVAALGALLALRLSVAARARKREELELAEDLRSERPGAEVARVVAEIARLGVESRDAAAAIETTMAAKGEAADNPLAAIVAQIESVGVITAAIAATAAITAAKRTATEGEAAEVVPLEVAEAISWADLIPVAEANATQATEIATEIREAAATRPDEEESAGGGSLLPEKEQGPRRSS